jgi:hypothetical protein
MIEYPYLPGVLRFGQGLLNWSGDRMITKPFIKHTCLSPNGRELLFDKG